MSNEVKPINKTASIQEILNDIEKVTESCYIEMDNIRLGIAPINGNVPEPKMDCIQHEGNTIINRLLKLRSVLFVIQSEIIVIKEYAQKNI